MRLTWPHLLVLLLVVLLLFGASRLPDVARNLGKSMKILKSEVRDLRDDEDGQGTPSDSGTAATASPGPSTAPSTTTSPPATPDPGSPFAPGGRRPDLPHS